MRDLGTRAFVYRDPGSPSGYHVLLNAFRREHPDDFAHTLMEEAVHVLQHLQGFPFDYSLPYEQRAHEIDAKRHASQVVRYERPDFPAVYISYSRFWISA